MSLKGQEVISDELEVEIACRFIAMACNYQYELQNP